MVATEETGQVEITNSSAFSRLLHGLLGVTSQYLVGGALKGVTPDPFAVLLGPLFLTLERVLERRMGAHWST